MQQQSLLGWRPRGGWRPGAGRRRTSDRASHHRRLSSPREVRNAIAYVLNNARKHLRGRVEPGWIDPASSGRWFWGRAVDIPAVAPPRFWLLRVGWWMRHGPIPVP